MNCESFFLDKYHGKKRAIDLGVQNSFSEFVMIMDSDISFKDVYFTSIKKNIDLSYDLYLTSVVEKNGIVWSRILSYSISVISIGLANLGIPILANGAGLIFRRKSYNKLLLNIVLIDFLFDKKLFSKYMSSPDEILKLE